MNFFRHKTYTVAFKGLLVVLYFILFGAQLSHKFYLYANAPTRLLKVYVWEICHQPSTVYSRSVPVHYKIFSSMSLDKRYGVQHIFALFSPALKVGFSYLIVGQETFFRCRPFIPSYPAVQFLRGPPFA